MKLPEFENEMEFREWLFEDLCITNNPRRGILYGLAWDYGHSAGYSEIYLYATDLVMLLEQDS